MCKDLASKVLKIVDSWTNEGHMFTAFDVTVQLRKDGESVAHWEVRDEVRGLFNDGVFSTYCYGRQLVDVMSASTFVYYNIQDGSDTTKYDPYWLNAVSTPFDSPIPATTPAIVPAVGVNTTSQVVAELTSENRLNISSILLRKMGVKPGDFVSVDCIIEKNTPMVYVTSGNGGDNLQVADVDGRIRLSESTLKEAFLTVQSEYTITYDNKDNSIYVKE